MPMSLNAILKKDYISSKDVGVVLMYYAKATFEQKPFPLSGEELSSLKASITYRGDKYKFDVYQAFYDAIRIEHSKAYDNARRIAGGSNLIRHYIRYFNEHSERDTLHYRLPLTLTSYGFNLYGKAAKQAALKRNFTFYEIFSNYLFFYMRLYLKEPALLSSRLYSGYALTESQPIEDKSIKEEYKQTHHETFIVDEEHPEGISFDSPELTGDYLLEHIKAHSVTKYELSQLEETIRDTDRAYYLDDMEELKRGVESLIEYGLCTKKETESENLKSRYAEIINEYRTTERIPARLQFKSKEKPMPEGTTVFVLLSEALEKYDSNNSNPAGLLFVNDKRTPAKQLREFIKAAPELFEALCEQICYDIPKFKDLDSSKLLKATINGEELKNLCNDVMRDKFENVSFADIREFVINSKNTSYLEKRQAANGIAMYSIMEGTERPEIKRLQRESNPKTYNPPMPEPQLPIKKIAEADIAAVYEHEIYKPLKMINAYNAFIRICAKALKVDFMKCAEFKEMSFILMNIRDLNTELFAAYRNIQGDDKTKSERERIFKETFQPVDTEQAAISQEMLDRTEQALKAMLDTKNAASWIKEAQLIIKKIAENNP